MSHNPRSSNSKIMLKCHTDNPLASKGRALSSSAFFPGRCRGTHIP